MDNEVQIAIDFLVEYSLMRKFCLNRSECKGCPYRPYKVCQQMEPADVIELVGSTLLPYRST
jgi:hypothetical protein